MSRTTNSGGQLVLGVREVLLAGEIRRVTFQRLELRRSSKRSIQDLLSLLFVLAFPQLFLVLPNRMKLLLRRLRGISIIVALDVVVLGRKPEAILRRPGGCPFLISGRDGRFDPIKTGLKIHSKKRLELIVPRAPPCTKLRSLFSPVLFSSIFFFFCLFHSFFLYSIFGIFLFLFYFSFFQLKNLSTCPCMGIHGNMEHEIKSLGTKIERIG